MRLSRLLFVTLREDPAEAEIPSHKLLLRAGYIRRVGSGIYAYLPLMWRVLQKISAIVREEMDAAGAQECLLPQLQPAELWKESGRWDTYTKAEGIMFTLEDRQEREFGLGPTHEEIITSLARDTLRSYRQLPFTLYQIQTKFRDEIRPRFGLMRGREFIMKDAYSFNLDENCLEKTYRAMDIAYRNVFNRCALAFRAVEADSGAIGGSASQEFMVLAEAGEDEVLYSADGLYAANVEKAVSLPPEAVASPFTEFEERETPGANTIEALAVALDCSPTAIVKTVLYEAVYDTGMVVPVLVCTRGDREVNEVKLLNELTRTAGARTVLSLKVPDETAAGRWWTRPLPFGYIGPDLGDDYLKKDGSVAPAFLRLADHTVRNLRDFVAGANEIGRHRVGARWGREFPLPERVLDLDRARPGDRSSRDPGQILESARGIEVGHIFQLGYKYSRALGATYTNEAGESVPPYMGCYGIGISRLAQAAVEQSHDRDGIVWPVEIAPYRAIVVIPNPGDAEQVRVAERLYTELNRAGIETLLDDRDERAGVKFKDADLIGIPYRLVTGKSLKWGRVELVERKQKTVTEVAIDEVTALLKGEPPRP